MTLVDTLFEEHRQHAKLTKRIFEQAVLEKVAYCIANPVAAGLVRRADQWPGVTTTPEQLGRASWTAKRPDFYIRAGQPAMAGRGDDRAVHARARHHRCTGARDRSA